MTRHWCQAPARVNGSPRRLRRARLMLRSRAVPAAAKSRRSCLERCAPSRKPGGHAPRLERTRRVQASMTSRLRLAFVRAARASSARRSSGGKWTVVVGTNRAPPRVGNRIYSSNGHRQCARIDSTPGTPPLAMTKPRRSESARGVRPAAGGPHRPLTHAARVLHHGRWGRACEWASR